MASVRVLASVLAGVTLASVSLAGCNPPKPDYTVVKYPAPYRTEPNGQWIDNEDYALDAQGYRVDKQGQRIGEVDVRDKTKNEQSNAMAGFYISSTGKKAPGSVMVPSEGGAAGAGFGPGSANPMPSGAMPEAAPGASGSPAPTVPSTTGGATGAPVPITPTPTR
jgi:hypothetical protein